MAEDTTVRGRTAVIGVGESVYYRHGRSPKSDLGLALDAIRAAAADAGIAPEEIDGFSSYSGNTPGPLRLAPALGCREVTFADMAWEGGGGCCAAAVANAAAAIVAGYAKYVVVFRSIRQAAGARYGQGRATATVSGDAAYAAPYGMFTPAQMIAPRVVRFMHDNGVSQEALRAVSLAAYHHAQANPRAVMHGRPLGEEDYGQSRWITEPFHLFDCCQENDGAAAIIMTSAERAADGPHEVVTLLGAAQGTNPTFSMIAPSRGPYGTANFTTLAPRLWAMAGVGPSDVDVLQAYENFTGATVMSVAEHGFCELDAINEFFTLENLTSPGGGMPLNTSGGNIAEAYIHGMELIVEAVRQLWGTSCNQVPDARVAAVIGGPVTAPVSDLVFGRDVD